MALTDPIADALTLVRNASRARKQRLDVRASAMVTSIMKILRQEKFIFDYRLIEDKKQGILRVYLSKENEAPARRINRIVRISKPGLRIYTKKESIPTVLNGLGVCILSTPEGLLSGEQAKRRGVGGEVICKIW